MVLAKMVSNLLLINGKEHSLSPIQEQMVFKAVPFRFETKVRLDEIIHEDRLSLVTAVPYIHFLMQEEICRGTLGKAVVNLLVIRLRTMGDEVVRSIRLTGRIIVLPFARMGDEPLATIMGATNVVRVQRIEVYITKLTEILSPKS